MNSRLPVKGFQESLSDSERARWDPEPVAEERGSMSRSSLEVRMGERTFVDALRGAAAAGRGPALRNDRFVGSRHDPEIARRDHEHGQGARVVLNSQQHRIIGAAADWDNPRSGDRFMARAVGRSSGRLAFSLVELLVVMTLLSFIVLGLMAVFNQTQRAFKLGMAQVDVLESGRAAMDLITREMGEMAAMSGTGYQVTNFVVEVSKDGSGNPIYSDLVQELPGTSLLRTNILQEFFFVSRVNQEWVGTAYYVSGGADGIGTLYRFTTSVPARTLSATLGSFRDLYDIFNRSATISNSNPVAEGIIHLRVQAYGTNGYLLDPYYDRGVFTNIAVDYDAGSASSTYYAFRSDALPTAVEIELGVVEPDVWQRAEALPTGQIRREYLAKEAGKVHLFKQRVPIRGADPEAYKQ